MTENSDEKRTNGNGSVTVPKWLAIALLPVILGAGGMGGRLTAGVSEAEVKDLIAASEKIQRDRADSILAAINDLRAESRADRASIKATLEALKESLDRARP